MLSEALEVTPNEDHPRLRGEYGIYHETEFYKAGSPPPARGIFLIYINVAVFTGITPACAGNINSHPLPLPGVGDHPRLRGEYT